MRKIKVLTEEKFNEVFHPEEMDLMTKNKGTNREVCAFIFI